MAMEQNGAMEPIVEPDVETEPDVAMEPEVLIDVFITSRFNAVAFCCLTGLALLESIYCTTVAPRYSLEDWANVLSVCIIEKWG